MKKIVSVLCVLALLLTMLPGAVFAVEPDVTLTLAVKATVGTTDTVRRLDDLRAGDIVTAEVKMPQDVSLSGFQVDLKFDKNKFEVTSTSAYDEVLEETVTTADVTSFIGNAVKPEFTWDLTPGTLTNVNNNGEATMVATCKYNGSPKNSKTKSEAVLLQVKLKVKDAVAAGRTSFTVDSSYTKISYFPQEQATAVGYTVGTPEAQEVTIVQEISSVALLGDLTPHKNATPATTLTENTGKVDVAVTWNPAIAEGGKFAAKTVYTATIKVTPKTGYVWSSDVEFNYDNLTFSEETSGSATYVATKTFAATEDKEIPSVKNPTVTGTATYGDKLSVLTLSSAEDETIEGTWAWKNPDELVGNAGTPSHVAVFRPSDTNNYTTAEKQVQITVNPKSLSSAAIADIEDQPYNNGSDIRPEPEVKLGGVTLEKDTDFTYSYENNKTVAAASATNAPKVTITGNGNYTGTASKTFTIVKSTPVLTLGLLADSLTYSHELKYETNYKNTKLYYQSTAEGSTAVEYTNATKLLNVGTYKVWVVLSATDNTNEASSGKVDLTINPKKLTNKSIEITGLEKEYNGEEQTFEPVVKDGTTTLVKDKDYTYEGELKLTNAGSGTVTITGTGNYKDSKTVTYQITPKSITVAITEIAPVEYDGEAKTPEVTVTADDKTLEKDTDYTVEYSNNINAGSAVATVKAKAGGNYTFSNATKDFQITKTDYTAPANIPALYVVSTEAGGGNSQQVTYNLTGVISEATGIETKDGVSYSNGTLTFTMDAKSKDTTTDTVSVTVKMANYNDYTLTIPVQYVSKKPISDELSMENVTFTYGDTPVTPVLKWNDVAVNSGYTITYQNDGYTESALMPKNAGTYTITAKYEDSTQDGVYPGHIGTVTATLTITPKELTAQVSHDAITYGDDVPTDGYSVNLDGVVDGDTLTSANYTVGTKYTKGNDADEYDFTLTLKSSVTNYTLPEEKVSGKLTVNPKTLTEDMVADITGSFTYSGEAQTPTVTVTDGTALTKGTDYTVAYSNNVNAAKSTDTNAPTVTVTGKGNYTGAVTKKFTIGPRSIQSASVGVTSPTYDGTEQKPNPTVKDGTKTLVKDTDYTVTYTNNVNAAKSTDTNAPTMTITGKGNYTGTRNEKFSINKRNITIKAENKSSRVGEAQKELTWTISGESLATGDKFVQDSIALTLNKTFDSTSEGTYTITVALDNVQITNTDGTEKRTNNYSIGHETGTYTVSNKLVPAVTAQDINVAYSGADVPTSAANPTAKYENAAVAGTWSWKGGTAPKNVADSGTKTLVFTPEDSVNYTAVEKEITVTIRKADPTGEPAFTVLDAEGKTLADAKLNVGTISPAGTIAWELAENTKVESGRAYTWIFTPTDSDNYNTKSGTLVVYTAEPDIPEERTIRISTTKHGELIIKPRAAKPGTEVTIYAEPDEGYTLDELYILDSRGNEVKLSRRGGKYTFLMPERDVTVYATFKAAQQSNPFDDVSRKDYFYDAVLWAVENGVTSGTGASTFSPDDACTRAQTVTFLWRAAGSPSVRGVENPFDDVSRKDYFYEAVLWAVQEGITTGTSATTFSPEATVTRGQVATFLYRLANAEKRTYTHPFADVAAGSYNDNAIGWAYAHEITTGTSKTTFGPDEACNRAQIVTFLYRYYGLAF